MTNKNVTRKEVADRAGVSESVVSFVLNNVSEKYSDETRKRVKKAMKELGYFPNPSARRLKMNKTFCIGIMVHDLRNPVVNETVIQIQRFMAARNYMCSIVNTDGQLDLEEAFLKQCRAKLFDGLILRIYNAGVLDSNLIHQIPGPKVSLYDQVPGCSSLVLDDEHGGYIATDYLIRNHHKRIGLVLPDGQWQSAGQNRRTGYKKALAEHNIPYDKTLVVASDTFSWNHERALNQLLHHDPPPTGIILYNDKFAYSFIKSLHDKGYEIPRDMAIIGYDDTPYCEFITPRLTSVNICADTLGLNAAQMLFDQLNLREPQCETRTLPTTLTLRDSA